jgi:prepilin-type N-terminal cleavage/methylation domain-containing protein
MSRRGFTLVELLAGLALAALLTPVAVGVVASVLRMLGGLAIRAEADDVAHLAVEAFAFDLRRAGFDPRGIAVDPLAEARPDRLTLQADLDGDGVVDAGSEETVAYACATAAQKLSRVVGTQSLPLASDVVTCTLGYLDAGAAPIPTPATGLDAAARRRVRAVTLDLAIVPASLHAPTTRRTTVALRVLP